MSLRSRIINLIAWMQADIWSLGITVYQLFADEQPYEPPPKDCKDPAGFVAAQVLGKELDLQHFPRDLKEFIKVHTTRSSADMTSISKAIKPCSRMSPNHAFNSATSKI